MAANHMYVLGGSIVVGHYITTKPETTWWKVEAIREEPFGHSTKRVFEVVNKAGYRKEISDIPGTNRHFYRWIPSSPR